MRDERFENCWLDAYRNEAPTIRALDQRNSEENRLGEGRSGSGSLADIWSPASHVAV